MAIFLGKKKATAPFDENLQQLTRQIEYLKRENSELRLQLDESRLASHTNKQLIDQLFKLVSCHQTSAKALEARLEKAESVVNTHSQALDSLETLRNSGEEGDDLLIFDDGLAASRIAE